MNMNSNHGNMGYCNNRQNKVCRQQGGSCNCRRSTNNRCDNTLAKEIQEIDFAIYETILYLDVYPYNRDALEYYHSLIHHREHLVAEYQKNNSPMTAFGNESHSSWDWISSPWPWEPSAN